MIETWAKAEKWESENCEVTIWTHYWDIKEIYFILFCVIFSQFCFFCICDTKSRFSYSCGHRCAGGEHWQHFRGQHGECLLFYKSLLTFNLWVRSSHLQLPVLVMHQAYILDHLKRLDSRLRQRAKVETTKTMYVCRNIC